MHWSAHGYLPACPLLYDHALVFRRLPACLPLHDYALVFPRLPACLPARRCMPADAHLMCVARCAAAPL